MATSGWSGPRPSRRWRRPAGRAVRPERTCADGVVKLRQVVEAGGHVGVLRAEGFLLDGERPLEERLGLQLLALVVVEPR